MNTTEIFQALKNVLSDMDAGGPWINPLLDFGKSMFEHGRQFQACFDADYVETRTGDKQLADEIRPKGA